MTLDDKWANVAKSLSYQPERDTATAMMERVNQIKRGAVKAFHTLHTPADPRLRPRKDPERAPEIAQRRKIDIVLETLSRGARYVREQVHQQLSQDHGLSR